MHLNSEIHKLNWTKTIVTYGKWYLISSLLTKGLNILMLPIYTSYLSTEDFGIFQSLNSIAQLLPFFLSCSLDVAFSRYYHEFKNNKSELIKLFSTIYWFVSIYGAFVIFLFIVISYYWIPGFLNIPVFPLAYLSFIPVLFSQLANLGRVFLQQSLNTKRATLLDVASAVVNLVTVVSLLVVLKLGLISMLVGISTASIFLFLYYTRYFVRLNILQIKFSLPTLYKSLKYSIPLIPAMAGSWLAGSANRLIITKYCGLSDVGIFSLGFQLASILYVIGDALSRVTDPLSMSGLVNDKNDTKKKISNIAISTLGIMLIFNIGIYLFSNEFVALFAPSSYSDSAIIIPLIGFAYVLGIQQRYPTQVLLFHKKTILVSLATILMGIINILVNLLLVPQVGFIGSALATITSSLFSILWIIFWAQKIDKLDYNWTKYFLLLSLFIISILISRFFFASKIINLWSVIMKMLYLVLFSLIVIQIINRGLVKKYISKFFLKFMNHNH